MKLLGKVESVVDLKFPSISRKIRRIVPLDPAGPHWLIRVADADGGEDAEERADWAARSLRDLRQWFDEEER